MLDWKYMPAADWIRFLFVSVVASEVEQKHYFTNPVDHQYSKLATKTAQDCFQGFQGFQCAEPVQDFGVAKVKSSTSPSLVKVKDIHVFTFGPFWKNKHNITYLFSKVVLHKDYGKPQDYQNDIALIQLDKVVGKKEGNFETKGGCLGGRATMGFDKRERLSSRLRKSHK